MPASCSRRAFCVAAAAIGLAGCATSVVSVPANFSAAAGPEMTLASNASILLPTGYTRLLSQGSRWRKVGTLQQGDVYQCQGSVFTIEGRNIHEAYLVLTPARTLVGFYLPGESRFSTLTSSVPLSIKEIS